MAAMSAYMGGSEPRGGGNSSCITVFGLSFDATEREVHVLFSGCPGYVRCIVVPPKDYSKKPYAFVQFDSQASALQAMESRQGTTWDEGLPAVNLELARRDIPENFMSRQTRAELQMLPPASIQPPLKRPRQEAILPSVAPRRIQPAPLEEDGPRTLHVGGLPADITQEELEVFIDTNFPDSCIGGKLAEGGKGLEKGMPPSGRAFVGFVSHQAAAEAQAVLEGFDWDGTTLHAEWARTEFRPSAAAANKGAPSSSVVIGPAIGSGGPGAGRGAGLVGPQSLPQLLQTLVAPASTGGGRGGGIRPIGAASTLGRPSTWEPQRMLQKPKPLWTGTPVVASAGAKRTLHFTNLPTTTEDEFNDFLSASFPEAFVCSRFVDALDGRPPVAWVLFADEASASSVFSSHQKFDWLGAQVSVQYARTELDPSKARK